MKNSTKSVLRVISVLLALALVLMELGIIPNLINYKFWFLVMAYALALITFKA
ncbi:MAG: hypothetical protein ACI9A7_000201 [Cyclobacteriaceae bacterium]|jgi:uncharacterized protein YebE (UPF0316 family)